MKKDFIIGTHYFGDGSPINMWSTLDPKKYDAYLREIEGFGFNNVVLLIPWASFHPDVSSRALDSDYVDKLVRFLESAATKNISVILRVGYLWDSTPDVMHTYERFSKIPFDNNILASWSWFLKSIYNVVCKYESFKFAFTSWEDFYWPIYRHYTNVKSESVLRQFMYDTGLLEYLNGFHSIASTASYDIDMGDLKGILNPQSRWYSAYTNYYDNIILRRILDISAMSFPGVSYEYRVDPEWLRIDDRVSYHDWNTNFFKSNIPVIYYHANIGVRSNSVMNINQATNHLKSLIGRFSPMKRLGQPLPFVDQFNFFDDTYAQWGGIEINDNKEYAKKVFNVMRNTSSGYAIWGYKDWRKDIVHNPIFKRGTEGWTIEGDYTFDHDELIIKGLCSVEQKIGHLALDEGERYVLVKGSSLVKTEITLKVTVDGNVETAIEESLGEFELNIDISPKGRVENLSILFDGEIKITQLSILGRSFSQGFASDKGELTPVAEELVKLQKHRETT